MSEADVTPDPRPTYARAARTRSPLVAAVGPEQLGLPTPCPEYDLRALPGHLVAGTERVAKAGEGQRAGGPDAPAWARDLPEHGWPKVYRAAYERLTAARADDAQRHAPVAMVRGRAPGRVAVAGSVRETVTHACDLARAIGRGGELDPELAEFALAAARRALPDEGGDHVPFGEARPVPEDAGTYARRAAFVDREPGGKGHA